MKIYRWRLMDPPCVLKGRTDDLRSPVTLSRHLPSFLGPWVVTYFQCVISFSSGSSLQENWYQLNLCYIDKPLYSKREVLSHISSQNDWQNKDMFDVKTSNIIHGQCSMFFQLFCVFIIFLAQNYCHISIQRTRFYKNRL